MADHVRPHAAGVTIIGNLPCRILATDHSFLFLISQPVADGTEGKPQEFAAAHFFTVQNPEKTTG